MESEPLNIGAYIRLKVIPSGMSVREAAKKLRVGRPALSNLLNGKAALSPEMALRLEQTFGADRLELLALQASLEQGGRREQDRFVAVTTYVPSFLTIKALQVDQWAESRDARGDLPVLLRKLIHSTGRELRQVDFPGYDNAERKGWDGWVEAAAATPWIVEGQSGWEFGTSEKPATKANDDYAARLKSVPAADRAETTFVFVTPWNWPGKTKWAKDRTAEGKWKEVSAFDASDLEQWLETSVSAQIWLAERLAIPTAGFETLDQCWNRWATASEPQMTPAIFEPSITAYRQRLKEWLGKPPVRPFVVASDSAEESLAFLACLFLDEEISAQFRDLAVAFDSPQVLKTLSGSSAPFIPIVATEETERELTTVYRRLHCIVVRPRNAVNSEPDIALDLLTQESFEKAVEAMGIDRDRAEQLGRASGRSPTILRRQLSPLDAIRNPRWSRDDEIAQLLIPMTLVGAWHTRSNADRELISTLADRPYSEIEEGIARLRLHDDSPVWSAGEYRGVTSKIDALFAITNFITDKQLSDFLLLAEYVLSESDPALELPEDQRWAAGLYGKLRDHSGALRQGICETLVILAVHGNNLFRQRLGFDAETQVSLVVRRLLSPLTLEKLMSQDSDLPRYAEAAPEEFLTLLEADLRHPEPVLLGLLKPANSGLFGRCLRTGLLWALECLAWKPQNLPRVTALLAQLSRTTIDDNWTNKPIASLAAIFRFWMPQTAASLDDRIKALEMLTRRHPDIGWQVCTQQFAPGTHIGHYSYRPHWRSDASGAGQVVTQRERYEFGRKALDLALAWPDHNERTLGDLVESLQAMAENDQTVVWNQIDKWADASGDDRAKAALRERIRRFAFTRRGRRHELGEAARERAREAYARLAPEDPVIRNAWLFAKQWVEESADELEDDDFDFSTRDERIHQLRLAAIREIWSAYGFDGIAALLQDSKAADSVGLCARSCAEDDTAAKAMILASLSSQVVREDQFDAFLAGFIWSIEADRRPVILSSVARDLSDEQTARLLRCAPFGDQTWRLLDQHSSEIRERYWRTVYPQWGRFTEAELTEIADRLLEVQRPRAAFHAAHMDWEKIETSRLKRLLIAVATTDAEPAGTFQLSTHDISHALEALGGRAEVTAEEMAQLEFIYIAALDHSKHGIPNLERQVAESPAVFVQAVALAYKSSDDSEDPPQWRVSDPDRREAAATTAHRLLERIRRIPGTDANGKVDVAALKQWLTETRRLCADHGRADIGDQCIGQLLSRGPAEEDGLRPCLPVCEAMESVAAEHIGRGFHVGTRNARGGQWRGAGGDQERELAAKYRGWAQRLSTDYPYVGAVLESIASSYDREAEREDSEALVNKRLRGWA